MNQYDEIVKNLELLLKTGIIDGSHPFIDIQISGYCINTFDNTIYPDFLLLYDDEIEKFGSAYDYKSTLSYDISKYCNNFFGDLFFVLPSNIKFKKITSPISGGGNQVTQ